MIIGHAITVAKSTNRGICYEKSSLFLVDFLVLIFSVSAYATPPISVEVNGNLQLLGTGTIYFADGTTQNTAPPVSTNATTNNTSTGFSALQSNTTGTDNTANGSHVLFSNTTGVDNTANGSYALFFNTTGAGNTANGMGALYNNTTGAWNTANGYGALQSNTTGYDNTAIGSWALYNNTTGYYNTAIGDSADVASGNLYNATAIGANAIVNASNKIRLGDGNVTVIEASVNLITLSDIRRKEDIKDITVGLAFIKSLKPVEFRMKNGNDRTDFGFIAQDIEKLIGTKHNILGIGGDAERTLSLRYTDFIAPMVKAMQEQQRIIDKQNDTITNLNDGIAKQNDLNLQMRKELDELKALVLSIAKK